MKLQIFLSTNDGTIFIFVPEKSNDIKSQAEESVMLRFNPDIYFLDIRVKPEYDREEAEDDIKEAALKRDSSSSVIPVLLFFPVIPVFFSSPLSFPCLARESKRDIRDKPEHNKEKSPSAEGLFPSFQTVNSKG